METTEKAKCWICLDSTPQLLSSICKCKGSMEFVHKKCLLHWIDTKMDQDPLQILCCPQCQAKYKIVVPFSMVTFIGDRIFNYGYRRAYSLLSVGMAGFGLGYLSWSYGNFVSNLMMSSSSSTSVVQSDTLTGLFHSVTRKMLIPFGLIALRYESLYTLLECSVILMTPITPNWTVETWALNMVPFVCFIYRNMRQAIVSRVSSWYTNKKTDSLTFYTSAIPEIDPDLPEEIREEVINEHRLIINDNPVTEKDHIHTCVGALIFPFLSVAVGNFFLSGLIVQPLFKNLMGGSLIVLLKDFMWWGYRIRKLTLESQRKILPFENDGE